MTSREHDSGPSIVSNMLLGPYLALQQAQQAESADRYLQRLAVLAQSDEPTADSIKIEGASWLAADLPAVVLCYRLRVSNKPVLEQLKLLLDAISQWCEGQKVCASSARLLGLWLDKLLRRDVALALEQEHKLKIMSLSTLEVRCLGRLVPDVVDWLKAHNAGGSLDIERLSGANCVLQALSAFRQSRDFAHGVEWLMAHGFGDEMTLLLYGALAGCFYPQSKLSGHSDGKKE